MIERIYGGCKISNESGDLNATAQDMLDIAAYVEKNRPELEAIIVTQTPGIDEDTYEKACAYLADIGEQASLEQAEAAAERYFATGSVSNFY